MEIFISLIIPIYSIKDYLIQRLNSIVNQMIPFNEVIIVNDGFIDYSLEICFDV